MSKTNPQIFRMRAIQLKVLRSIVLQRLFPIKSVPGDVPILNDVANIANSFSRFAAFQQTAFDQGATRSSVSADSRIHEAAGGACNHPGARTSNRK